jgi:hypothetical protein
VEAHVGRKVAGWPFGRLDIDDEDLTVRSSPLPWIRPRSASKQSIGNISLYRRWSLDHLGFADSADALSKVRLALPVRSKRIVNELRSRGYPVIDRRKKRLLPAYPG